MSISLKRQFEIRLTGVTTELCGVQFPGAGRRQLVPCPEGEIIGPDFHGRILSAGIDHQLIREDGTAEINASYGFRLDDGPQPIHPRGGHPHGASRRRRRT